LEGGASTLAVEALGIIAALRIIHALRVWHAAEGARIRQ